MQKIKHKIVSQEIYQAIRDYLPEDHSRAQALDHYLEQFFSHFAGPATVLDLGCGEGDSITLFRNLDAETIWHGVDIEDSPEGRNRVVESDVLSSFNGVDLPYVEKYFDLIYCHQVLEHVRHPDLLMADAFRVLKPGGVFLGSVSYLEPYHSFSIFNFTPYGISRVFEDAGFTLEAIRPGVDASMLINRQLFNRSKSFRPIWGHNFLHGIIELAGIMFRLGHRERNFLKVQFSGHLVFYARRPAEPKHSIES